MTLSQLLPSPWALKEKLPLSHQQKLTIHAFREEARHSLKDPSRLVMIVGPCSIHNTKSLLDYAKRLKALRETISSHLFIVLRSYIEKPRSVKGWKGLMYQPDPQKPSDLSQGIFKARELFIELTELGIPLCMEFVDPLSAYYFDDLLSWGAVGARTSASQAHRQLASSLPFPVGFKNTLDGNVEIPLQGMLSAAAPHTFLGLSQEGHIAAISSQGNPWTHLILRGSDHGTNYHATHLKNASLTGSRIMVDCAHGNSKKRPSFQREVFLTVLEEYQHYGTPLLGMMLESFIKEGHHSISSEGPIDPELSITDPCLNWETTAELMMKAYHTLIQSTYISSSK